MGMRLFSSLPSSFLLFLHVLFPDFGGGSVEKWDRHLAYLLGFALARRKPDCVLGVLQSLLNRRITVERRGIKA